MNARIRQVSRSHWNSFIIVCVVTASLFDSPHNRVIADPGYKDYTGYKVLTISPHTDIDLEVLRLLNKQWNLDFWKHSTSRNDTTDVMVSPVDSQKLEEFLSSINVDYSIKIRDVQRLIDKEVVHGGGVHRIRKRSIYGYNTNMYNTFDQINQHLIMIERRNKLLAKRHYLGPTTERRSMYVIQLSTGPGRRAVFIDGGFHAREWISHATACYLMDAILEGYKSGDPYYVDLLNKVDIYVLPVANPDGYEHSIKRDRLWRRTKSGPYCECLIDIYAYVGDPCKYQCCRGVDLNRNFGFKYGVGGKYSSSGEPCKEDYRGPRAWSEVEARNIRDFLLKHKESIDAYITLHSYGQFWFYPYGYAHNTFPPDSKDLEMVAHSAAKSLKAMYGTEYQVGSASALINPTSGTSDDWAKSIGIKYAYCIELRPNSSASLGFFLDETEIKPVGDETLAGLKSIFEVVAKRSVEFAPELLHKTVPPQSLNGKTAKKSSSSKTKFTRYVFKSKKPTKKSQLTSKVPKCADPDVHNLCDSNNFNKAPQEKSIPEKSQVTPVKKVPITETDSSDETITSINDSSHLSTQLNSSTSPNISLSTETSTEDSSQKSVAQNGLLSTESPIVTPSFIQSTSENIVAQLAPNTSTIAPPTKPSTIPTPPRSKPTPKFISKSSKIKWTPKTREIAALPTRPSPSGRPGSKPTKGVRRKAAGRNTPKRRRGGLRGWAWNDDADTYVWTGWST